MKPLVKPLVNSTMAPPPGVSRREFLELMGAVIVMGSLEGCREHDPIEEVVPSAMRESEAAEEDPPRERFGYRQDPALPRSPHLLSGYRKREFPVRRNLTPDQNITLNAS